MLRRQKGQGLVEFALLAPVLLATILAIIETALIFQGYLTVQHAAREAARWAVTYKPDRGMQLDGTPCDGVACDPNETEQEYWTRRVALIKSVALDRAVGLRIDFVHLGLTESDFWSFASFPNFYGVQVWGFPSFLEPTGGWTESQLLDHPGLPGLPVRVRVTHNVELLDPLFRAIVPRVRVVAQAEMINEGTQAGYGNVPPPALPTPGGLPTPEWEIPVTYTFTPTPDGSTTPTLTPTPTGTQGPAGTPTGTPTATPTGPFISLSDYQVAGGQVVLIDVNQHPPSSNPYELRWVDHGGGLIEVISATLRVDAMGFRHDIPYTVPAVGAGLYYVETSKLGAVVARSAEVEVLPPPPDLVVRSISVDPEPPANEEITVTVTIENLSTGPATGYFDVDLYVDPENPPITNRPGTSKQWALNLGGRQTKVITHVVSLYGGGIHELWAQVDTSDQVPGELNEDNNVFGPVVVTASAGECEDPTGRVLSDRFSGPGSTPEAKWSSARIGNATVHQTVVDEGTGTLSITANGTGLWNSPDAGATFLYQSVTGDFVATLRIIQPLTGSGQQWAQIGLMARNSTAANSRWVLLVRGRDALRFGYRSGSSAQNYASNVNTGVPVWVRLVRIGDTFTGYYSTDGASWVKGSNTGVATVDLNDTILIGIGATSYSATAGTGVVDDFEVCFLSASAESCQGYSDDFEADSLIEWSDVDIGATLPGSSTKSGGTMTVSGDGSTLWSSDNFHYTYQAVAGNFVATLRINSGPGQAANSKAGLMVRGSTVQDSMHFMVVKTRDHGLQFGYRPSNGGSMIEIGSETEDDTLPVWVRIARNGTSLAAYYSTNGTSWTYAGAATVGFSDALLVGLAVSSYTGTELGNGNFDDFLFCAGEAGDIAPPPLPPEDRPPGLKECVQTIELGNFEASFITPPWERNVDAFHASDRKHSGNFSLELRTSFGPPPEYRATEPWAYQAVEVPADANSNTIGTLSFWQFVIPDPEDAVPDPDDEFNLVIRNAAGVEQTAPIPLARGDTQTPVFEQQVISVENYMTGNRFGDLAAQEMQVMFYGVNNGLTPGTSFYIDDVRFDICNIEPIPAPVPGTASIGGLVEVLLHARPTKMPGIPVWAFAPGGTLYATRTIHDSTYHFYNIPPGRYTVYAEVWTEGILYTATTEVEVTADERNYGVNLLLQ